MNTIKQKELLKLPFYFAFSLLCFGTLAQQDVPTAYPEGHDYQPPILTLSKGQYVELIETDSVVRIADALYNPYTEKVVAILEEGQYLEVHNESEERFLSLDPLAKEFAWNSPYSFSENSVIAFVELEGLEKYFAANGTFIGSIGTDPTIMVINQKYIDAKGGIEQTMKNLQAIQRGLKSGYGPSGNHLQYLNTSASSPFGKHFDKTLTDEDYESMGKMLDFLYNEFAFKGDIKDTKADEIGIIAHGGPIKRGTSESYNDDADLDFHKRRTGKIQGFAANAEVFKNDIYVYLPIERDSYFDIGLMLYHESLHLKGGIEGGPFEEFKAHYLVTQHPDFDKTSPKFKRDNLNSMGNYLNKQYQNVLRNQDKQGIKEYKNNLQLYKKVKQQVESKK